LSLQFVVVLLLLSPFVIGTLASLFESNSSLTPVIIHRPVYVVEEDGSIKTNVEEEERASNSLPLVQVAEGQVSEHDAQKDKFLNELDRLEESREALQVLQEITPEIEPLTQTYTDYEVSELPPELNKSIDQLFAAIAGDAEAAEGSVTGEAVAEKPVIHPQVAPAKTINGTNLPEYATYMEGPDSQSIDEMIHHLYPMDQGGNVINFPSPSEYNLSIPPREYWALQQKYGPDVLNRITTTPAQGGTGDYDCMIGKVEMIGGVAALKYREYHIPLKGLDQEGVFLVEGMFVKPDVFFVTNYTELDSVTRASNKAAEN
jgi:hypothetical protein